MVFWYYSDKYGFFCNIPTIEIKLKFGRLSKRESVSDLVKFYNFENATICDIKSNKETVTVWFWWQFKKERRFANG